MLRSWYVARGWRCDICMSNGRADEKTPQENLGYKPVS